MGVIDQEKMKCSSIKILKDVNILMLFDQPQDANILTKAVAQH